LNQISYSAALLGINGWVMGKIEKPGDDVKKAIYAMAGHVHIMLPIFSSSPHLCEIYTLIPLEQRIIHQCHNTEKSMRKQMSFISVSLVM
jgi:hypothetical protein